jgi:hypothetical protein
MTNTPLKFFVDAQRPDGRWVLSEIACPRAEAESRAGELKLQHPDWLVEINSVRPPRSQAASAALFASEGSPESALATST